MWRIYKISFGKPIDQELVVEIDFLSVSHRNAKDIEQLYLLCKEGWIKSVLGEFHTQKQALSRFFLSALIQSDIILNVLRRELRRLSPDVRVETEEILEVLTNEVIKREVLEGDQAKDAARKISRASNKALRERKPKDGVEVKADDSSPETEELADNEPDPTDD